MTNPQEQQAIDALFQKVAQHAAQSGPRNPQVEALIQQRVQQTPGALYAMAQLLIGQEQAIGQLQQQVAQLQQSAQRQPAPAAAPPRRSGGDFLTGAAQIALGVGGGMLAAGAIEDIAGDLFDDDDDDDSW
ncbi:DUF2076 family protein [Nocardia arthritidis]|uniref:DUF2076 family protein n=1 Tax=Nocardia arthritidis TaxID=228602 RepID=A0A6G9YCT9_9NOCA|nr:DUF2076 family protein [Nocardia arthritidis]QIS10984.1 DUF2076 family protein [Nocardia arthritidis]